MSKSINPYPQYLSDDSSGLQVPSMEHQIWGEGYRAGKRDRQVIKTIIKSQSNMVMVFDSRGSQIPEYQGQYLDIKDRILRDAPQKAVFLYWPDYTEKPVIITKEEW